MRWPWPVFGKRKSRSRTHSWAPHPLTSVYGFRCPARRHVQVSEGERPFALRNVEGAGLDAMATTGRRQPFASPLPLPIPYLRRRTWRTYPAVTTRTSSPLVRELIKPRRVTWLVPGLPRERGRHTPSREAACAAPLVPRFRDDRTWRGPSLRRRHFASHGSIGGLTPEDAALLSMRPSSPPSASRPTARGSRLNGACRTALGAPAARARDLHFVSTSRRSSIGSEKGQQGAAREQGPGSERRQAVRESPLAANPPPSQPQLKGAGGRRRSCPQPPELQGGLDLVTGLPPLRRRARAVE